MPDRTDLITSLRDGARFAYAIADFYAIGLMTRPLGTLFWSLRYRKPDPWRYESSPYEQRKYALTLEHLPPPRDGVAYDRLLEVGCSEGVFTEQLARTGKARAIVATDVATEAAERARTRCGDLPAVAVECGDMLREPPPGRFDLVLCAETLSHLGSLARLRAMAERLVAACAPGGHLVLVDSWPKARLLCRPFHRHRDLELVSQHVERDPWRPYAITRFRHR